MPSVLFFLSHILINYVGVHVCKIVYNVQGANYTVLVNEVHTDFMENPLYGLHKLNPGLPFSVAIQNLSVYCFCTSIVPLHIVTYHR